MMQRLRKGQKLKNVDPKTLLMYAVTDRRWAENRTLYDQVRDALEGGATFIQLREKHMAHDAFADEARAIQALCAAYHVPFVLDDDVALAKAINADGVHVGQSDMAAGDVRKMLGDDKILGVSAGTVAQARAAEKFGADYLGVGAVFPTGSKDDAEAVSRDTLAAICDAVSIPVIAIGGITKDNVGQLAGTGIAGVAVISAIFAQPDITAATAQLKQCVKKAVHAK